MKCNFSLGKCKTKAAYSSKLQSKQKLDLKKIKEKFEVIMDTPILLVIKVEGLEIIVHSYGELLFKKGEDIKQMEKIAAEIYDVGL